MPSISRKPFASNGLPLGSKKNMVRCSPDFPAKRTTGGMSKLIWTDLFSERTARWRQAFNGREL